MGMLVSVHRAPRLGNYGDPTNGGLSGRHDTLTVVNVEGPFNPADDRPAVLLVPGAYGAPILVPAVANPDGTYSRIPENTTEYAGPMYGGNLADSSDSRWNKAVRKIIINGMKARGWTPPEWPEGAYAANSAVPIHDRVETWADYEVLTR